MQYSQHWKKEWNKQVRQKNDIPSFEHLKSGLHSMILRYESKKKIYIYIPFYGLIVWCVRPHSNDEAPNTILFYSKTFRA